jgi:hypothetical protein
MRFPVLMIALALVAGCSYPKQASTTSMQWEKTSDLAPPLEQARQDCKTQTLAESSKMGTTGGAYVGGEFVKCMRAAGWTLVER